MSRVSIAYYAFFGREKKHIEISQVLGACHRFLFHVHIEKKTVCKLSKEERKEVDGRKYYEWEASENTVLTLEDIDYVTALIDYELDLLDETLTTLSGIELRRKRRTTFSEWDFFVNGTQVKRWIYYKTREDWYWSAGFDHQVEKLKIIYLPE